MKLNVSEVLKERMSNAIDKVFNNNDFNSIESVMPLIYILRAFKEGRYVTITSRESNNIFANSDKYIYHIEDASELLNSIRNSVNKDYFLGIYANLADSFYQELLKSFDFNTICEVYPYAIDYIIQKISLRIGRSTGVSTTPKEVSRLVSELLSLYNCKKIYNPFAGLGTIAIQNYSRECEFYCQELNPLNSLLAKIRLDAYNCNAEVDCSDSIVEWKGEDSKFDAIVAEPPFGMRLEVDSRPYGRANRSEEFPFYAALEKQSAQYGIYILPTSVCYQRLTSDMKTTALIKSIIDTVIELPSHLNDTYSIATCIVVFNLKGSHSGVKLINASNCFIQEGRKRKLDVDTIMNILKGNTFEPSPLYKIEPEHILLDNNAIILPSRYAYEIPYMQDGDRFVNLSDVVTFIRGNSIHANRDRNINDLPPKEIVITSEDLYSDVVEMKSNSEKTEKSHLDMEKRYKRVSQPCIISTPTFNSFYWKKDDSPVYLSEMLIAFYPNDLKQLDPVYLVYAIQEAKKRQNGMGFTPFSPMIKVFLKIILPTPSRQEDILNSVFASRLSLLEEKRRKLVKLSSLNDSSSDLLHELGLTFSKISAGIGLLDKDDKTTQALSANVKFALRMINSAGANFKDYCPSLKRVSMVKVIQDYLDQWEHFGYKSFSITKSVSYIPEEVKVEIDIDLLYTALDCILTNAHQHGFMKKPDEDNAITVELHGVVFSEDNLFDTYVMLSIGNNGKPFDKDLSIEKYVERGFTVNRLQHNGLGGDHISKIMHLFNGFTSIVSSNEWNYVNLFIPMYVKQGCFKLDLYEEPYI